MSGPELTGDRGGLAAGGPLPLDVDLGRVWLGVATQVWRRRPGRVERLAGCCAPPAWPGPWLPRRRCCWAGSSPRS